MKRLEKVFEVFFLLCAAVAVAAVAVITLYIFIQGFPAMARIGVINFIFGKEWNPSANLFGIFPMIAGSVYVTAGAAAAGIPVGILTAVFLSELAPRRLVRLMLPAVELLAGIPSVVYGFFGLIVLVPMISERFGGAGNSLLAAILILGVMILPTVIRLTKTSLDAVPESYREGSLALGASKLETVFRVVIPAAGSGILSASALAVGRAVGETMAVILVAGNTPVLPSGITSSFRAMTSNIALEMGYAGGLHQGALFATGVVLFLFIMLLNAALHLIKNKAGD
jgi:phosphate transport system permease protein